MFTAIHYYTILTDDDDIMFAGAEVHGGHVCLSSRGAGISHTNCIEFYFIVFCEDLTRVQPIK